MLTPTCQSNYLIHHSHHHWIINPILFFAIAFNITFLLVLRMVGLIHAILFLNMLTLCISLLRESVDYFNTKSSLLEKLLHVRAFNFTYSQKV